MHLTNPDIHKKLKSYHDDPRPFYWSIQEMFKYVDKNEKPVRDTPEGELEPPSRVMWRRVGRILAKTFLSVEPKLTKRARKYVRYKTNSFELLGFDVLIDKDLKPWVIEANPDPDLTAHKGFELALRVKTQMLSDMFTVLGYGEQGRKWGDTWHAALTSTLIDAAAGKRYFQANRWFSFLHRPWKGHGKAPTLAGDGGDSSDSDDGAAGLKCHVAVAACGVKTTDDARMIATAEIEYARRGGYSRVFPVVPVPSPAAAGGRWGEWDVKENGLLNVMYEPRRTDDMLACWEFEMAKCGMR